MELSRRQRGTSGWDERIEWTTPPIAEPGAKECRRLGADIADEDRLELLNLVAEEYEAQADHLEGDGPGATPLMGA